MYANRSLLVPNAKNSHGITDMTDFFHKEPEISDMRVWNMVRFGCGRAQLVERRDPNRSLRMVDADNRDSITSIEYISIESLVMLRLIIISGAHILFKWREDDVIDGGTLFYHHLLTWRYGSQLVASFHRAHCK